MYVNIATYSSIIIDYVNMIVMSSCVARTLILLNY